MAAYGVEQRLGLARHYLSIGNPKRALAELEQTGEALDAAEYWVIRAEALFELGRWRDAAEAARRGLEVDADHVTLLDVLAISELRLGHENEADQAILAALAAAPDHPTLLAHRATMLAKWKRHDEADAAIAQAMRVDPQSPDVVMARSVVARLRGDRRAATQHADELLALEPESELSHLARGNAEISSARFKHALRHFEEAARLNPGKPHVQDAVREARIGAHPLLAPVRPIWRLGRWRSVAIYFTLASLLAAARLQSLRLALMIFWVSAIALSWIAPPLLRRWYGRSRRGL